MVRPTIPRDLTELGPRLASGRHTVGIPTLLGNWYPRAAIRRHRAGFMVPIVDAGQREESVFLRYQQPDREMYRRHANYRLLDTVEDALLDISERVHENVAHRVGLSMYINSEDGNEEYRRLSIITIRNIRHYQRNRDEWFDLLRQVVGIFNDRGFTGERTAVGFSSLDVQIGAMEVVFQVLMGSIGTALQTRPNPVHQRLGTPRQEFMMRRTQCHGVDQNSIYRKTFHPTDVMALFEGVVDPSGVPVGTYTTDRDCVIRALCLRLRDRLNPYLPPANHFSKKWREVYRHRYEFVNAVEKMKERLGLDDMPKSLEEVMPWFIEHFKDSRFFILNGEFQLLHIYHHPATPFEQFQQNYFFIIYNTHLYVLEKPNWVRPELIHCCTCFRSNCPTPDQAQFMAGNCTYLKNLPPTVQTEIRPLNQKDYTFTRDVKCVSCQNPLPFGQTNNSKRVAQTEYSHKNCSPHVYHLHDLIPDGYRNKNWMAAFPNMTIYPVPSVEGRLGVPVGEKRQVLWVWDIESMLVAKPMAEVFPNRGISSDGESRNVYVHEPNLVKALLCFTNAATPVERTFQNLSGFLEWVLGMHDYAQDPYSPAYTPPNKTTRKSDRPTVTFLAHNAKGYDNRLLLDEIRKSFLPACRDFHTSYDGNKILKIGFQTLNKTRVNFQDSLCHLPMALRKLPKALGLDKTMIHLGGTPIMLEKGEFPYTFNRPEHQDYVGPIPDIKWFTLDRMSKDRALEIQTWHTELKNNNYLYDFKREMEKYCYLDVVVLKAVVELHFHRNYEINFYNPFQKLTLASYCLAIFFKNYIPKTITYAPQKNKYIEPRPIYHNTLRVLSPDQMEFARRALRGGRTDVRQRYAVGQMKYIDVVSLYPYVQFSRVFPTGTATTLYNPPLGVFNFDAWEHYAYKTSIFEIDIDVVDYIHHPVLIVNLPPTGFKFLDEAQTTIDASGRDGKSVACLYNLRRFVTTGVELFYAMKTRCYRLLHVYRVDNYSPEKDLFRDYIRTFMKIKMEASGFDGDEVQWKHYSDEAKQMGIRLNRQDMVRNEGKRFIAKLCLNSLWGKLGQAPEVKEVFLGESVETLGDYLPKMNDGLINSAQCKRVAITDRPWIQVEANAYDVRLLSSRTAYPVAAYVAAWGRLTLWETLNQLGERVVYHDTDSIIYHLDPNPEHNIREGTQLGEWEAEENGEILTEVVAVAPKMYGYRVGNKEKVKLKGVQLSQATEDKISFEYFKKIVTGEYLSGADRMVEQQKFEWMPEEGQIVTYDFYKEIKGNYTKGYIDPTTYKTYPFGTERFRPELNFF